MANDRVRFGKLSFKGKNDPKAKSVLTVWKGANGGYSITKDKHSDQWPAIGLFDALKSWGMGEGYLDFWLADQPRQTSTPRPQTTQGPRADREMDRDFAAEDEFTDDGCPF
jgi:hypothetical protein